VLKKNHQNSNSNMLITILTPISFNQHQLDPQHPSLDYINPPSSPPLPSPSSRFIQFIDSKFIDSK